MFFLRPRVSVYLPSLQGAVLTSRRRSTLKGQGRLAPLEEEADGLVAGGDVLDPSDLPPGCPKVEVPTRAETKPRALCLRGDGVGAWPCASPPNAPRPIFRLLEPFARLFFQVRTPSDFTEEEYFPNELEVIVVRGEKLRTMDRKTLLNRNPSSVIFTHKEGRMGYHALCLRPLLPHKTMALHF
jgi:hypothetical protein